MPPSSSKIRISTTSSKPGARCSWRRRTRSSA